MPNCRLCVCGAGGFLKPNILPICTIQACYYKVAALNSMGQSQLKKIQVKLSVIMEYITVVLCITVNVLYNSNTHTILTFSVLFMSSCLCQQL